MATVTTTATATATVTASVNGYGKWLRSMDTVGVMVTVMATGTATVTVMAIFRTLVTNTVEGIATATGMPSSTVDA